MCSKGKKIAIAGGAVAAAAVAVYAGLCVKQARDISRKNYEYKSLQGIPPRCDTHVELHGTLYDKLSTVMTVLKSYGVPHWAIGGTAIGALRHRGIIPWDDDVDLGIKAEDVDRSNAALRCAGMSVVKTWWGHKIGECVDLFPYGRDGQYQEAAARLRWPKEVFDPKDVEAASVDKIPSVEFGPIRVPVLSGTEAYLDKGFGPNWRTHCSVKAPHDGSLFSTCLWHANPFIIKSFDLPRQLTIK